MLTGRKGKDMGFSKNADGIFVKDEVSVSSAFTAKMQDELFAIEDGSWWFQYRAQVLTETAERYLEREVETLDIGGGNGYTTSRMQQVGFRTALLEPSYEACLHARQRGISRCFCSALGDFEEPIRQGMLLDVLEHIEDDRGFLGTLRAHMPGGDASDYGSCAFGSLEQRRRGRRTFPTVSYARVMQVITVVRFRGRLQHIFFQLFGIADFVCSGVGGKAWAFETPGQMHGRGKQGNQEQSVQSTRWTGRACTWGMRSMGKGAVAESPEPSFRQQHLVRGEESVKCSPFPRAFCLHGGRRTT